MRIIAVSDLHPDKSTAGYPRFDDVRKAAMQAAEYSRSVNADLFLFLGDLCEPDSPDYIRCVCLAMEVMARASGVKICIPGNHDIVEDGRGTTSLDPLAFMENVFVESEPGVLEIEHPELAGEFLKIACFPYVALDQHYDPTDALSEMHDAHDHVDLVLSHLMLDGIGPGSEAEMVRGRDVFLPVEAIQKAWPRAKILNGHYHRRCRYGTVEVVGSLANFTRSDRGDTPCFLELVL